MNKIIVIGHLGRDPEMRYTPNGQSVTSFSVASSHRYTTSAGERREETEWFNVSAFGKLAELCNQYLTKGRQVYVEGRLRSRSFQGNDGQTRHVNEINLSDVQFLGARGGEGGAPGTPYERDADRVGAGGMTGGSGGGSGGMEGGGPGSDEVDDLPF
ncbi:MAG: single-stranded DNA-binding protein [Dehalococcoidia bacterium]|nr:single-stranded DNA-binding protein [Dehalococcoidia bacterium]MSQ17452.1 single-stranded DNA-binding protein [Dehalococcoidia bacterium]